MEQMLSGVKILDLTHHIAGPYCTKLFADYGADVLKVERPGYGDHSRSMGPFLNDDVHPEKSGLFLHLNTNKKSITLDLRTSKGVQLVKQLVKDVDIVVENFRPGVMSTLGLDYSVLNKINNKLVMTSISNFGQTGPYRDYKASELILWGWGGSMCNYGLPEREPVKKGGTVVLYQAGTVAAVATIIAFYAAKWKGVGNHIDVSIFEVMAGCMDRRGCQLVTYAYNQETTPRRDVRDSLRYPFGVYPCEDGYFEVAGSFSIWPRIARMIGRPDMADDPLLTSPQAQLDPAARDIILPVWLPWCLEHTKSEIIEAGQREGVMCGPINTMDEVLNDPHWKARGYWAEVDHPIVGRLTYPGAPAQGSETRWELRNPAPLLGQHNIEIYSKIGYSNSDIATLKEQEII